MAGIDPTGVADGDAGVYYPCIWRRLVRWSQSDCDAGCIGGMLRDRHLGGKGEMERV